MPSAAKRLAEGFAAIKLRVGRDDFAQDLAAVRAVKKRIGDGAALMCDFNQRLTVNEGLRRARVRYNHALALQKLGRVDEAEQRLLSVRAAAPEDPDVLRALVVIYAQQGKWEQALPHARALVELSPGEGPLALLLRVEEELARRDAGPPPGSG